MGKDRLEDYIKDQVYDYDSIVDTDDLWNKIQKKKKPKSFLWVYLTFGILFIGAMIATVWVKDMDSSMSFSSQELSESEVLETKEFIKENDLVKNNQQVGNYPITPAVNESKDLPENEVATNIDVNQPKNETTDNVVRLTSTRSQSLPTEDSNVIQGLGNSEKVNFYSQKNTDFRNDENSISLSSTGTSTNTSTSTNTKAKIIGSTQSENTRVSYSTVSSNNEKINSSLAQVDEKLSAIATIDINRLIYNRPLFPSTLDQEIIPLNQNDDKQGYWIGGISASFFKGDRTLNPRDTLSETRDTIFQLREQQEEFKELWGAGLSIGYQHRSGLFVNTGIAYHQINDRSFLSFTDTNTEFITGHQDSLSSFVQTETPIMSIRYNKIRMWDVPLSVGYFKDFEKVGLSTEVGLNINIRTQASGNFIKSDVAFQNTDNTELFKTNISYSYQLSIGLHRSLWRDWEISFHPTLRYYPKSFTADSYDLEQNYRVFGAQIKLSKSF